MRLPFPTYGCSCADNPASRAQSSVLCRVLTASQPSYILLQTPSPSLKVTSSGLSPYVKPLLSRRWSVVALGDGVRAPLRSARRAPRSGTGLLEIRLSRVADRARRRGKIVVCTHLDLDLHLTTLEACCKLTPHEAPGLQPHTRQERCCSIPAKMLVLARGGECSASNTAIGISTKCRLAARRPEWAAQQARVEALRAGSTKSSHTPHTFTPTWRRRAPAD